MSSPKYFNEKCKVILIGYNLIIIGYSWESEILLNYRRINFKFQNKSKCLTQPHM